MSCSVSHAVPVEVDHLGGGVLRDQSGSSLTVVSPELCYLDVIDCPELVSLDLSGCHPNCHVTLRGCPALRSLRVPATGCGAVIHLDAGDDVPSLYVSGLVDHFDACWSSGQCAASCVEVPWNGLWVSHGVQRLSSSHRAFTSECWVMLAPSMPHGVVDAPHLRHLLVSGGKSLNAISVVRVSRHSPQIALQGLPELLSVDLHAPKGCARLRACRSLSELSGQLSHLHLSEVAERSKALMLDVAASSITLSYAGLASLSLSEPTSLSLVHCPRLDQVSLPPATQVQCEGAVPSPLLGIATVVVDEALVTSLLQAYPRDPEGVMAKLAVLLPSMAAPADCLMALQLLEQLAALGAPLDDIWQIRLALSGRHLHSRRHSHRHGQHQRRRRRPNIPALALSQWVWTLPDDLCREGWMADYRLWRRCAPEVSEAFHYRRTMIRTCAQAPEGLAMRTVIQAMTRDDGSASVQERDLWRDLIAMMSNKAALSVPSWVQHSRRLALRYGHDPELDRLYLEACDALLPLRPWVTLLQRLGGRHPAVRVCLLRIAQRPERWRLERADDHHEAEALRAKAMTLAISRAA